MSSFECISTIISIGPFIIHSLFCNTIYDVTMHCELVCSWDTCILKTSFRFVFSLHCLVFHWNCKSASLTYAAAASLIRHDYDFIWWITHHISWCILPSTVCEHVDAVLHSYLPLSVMETGGVTPQTLRGKFL